MESLDKLREWLPNSLMPRTCEAVCRAYLDEIEREISEKYIRMPVRCMDCIRYSLDDYGNTWCAYVASAVQPDDFCAWGERVTKSD